MLVPPFYDPAKTYEENFQDGPFGAFADGTVVPANGEPQETFVGVKLHSRFGIPAGPLVNSAFVKAAFAKGFDMCVYKTVRSGHYPCHPWPNVLSLNIDGDLTPAKLRHPLVANTDYHEPLSITNSFGVPSQAPDFWQHDAARAVAAAGPGQVLIVSFMGTVRPGQSAEEFVADHALAARLAHETGARLLEVNLSCPNIGNEGLVCYDLTMTRRVCEAIRNVIGNTPLIIKIGYFQDEAKLAKLAALANEYADAAAAINTLQAAIIDAEGKQALPGQARQRSGVCGAGIKWAGLDMVARLKHLREANGYEYSIIGMGGVMNVDDYREYRSAGADAVMSATGAMWNPYLAQEIKREFRIKK